MLRRKTKKRYKSGMSPRTNRFFRLFLKLGALAIVGVLLVILAYRYVNPPLFDAHGVECARRTHPEAQVGQA